jgi:hypothetical protein
MGVMEKIKAYLFALLVGFFNPYPTRIAAAVAVLAVMGNLLGLFAAVRSGEKPSGSKVLKGNLRIFLYFLSFSALYHALRDVEITRQILSAIYSAIALHEFSIVITKATEVGVIPKGLMRKLADVIRRKDTATGESQSPNP